MSDYEKRLIEKGYKEFKPEPFKSLSISTGYQKRFDDKIGKKYFISIYKWKSWVHPTTQEVIPESYEYEIQFTRGGKALDLLFHSSWDIDDVEHQVEFLWETGYYDYYEVYKVIE